jgi:hypothetical protein
MVVFKENYDLTRRTPTPPAQRRQHEAQHKRQEERERHTAFRRGQFEAKRRLNHYIESQRAKGGDTRQIPALQQHMMNDDEQQQQDSFWTGHDDENPFSFVPSASTTGIFNHNTNNNTNNDNNEASVSTIHPHPFHYTLPSADKAMSAGSEMRTPLQRMQSGASMAIPVANGGGNTASIRGGAGFLSLQNSARRVHPWTLDAPKVSNDSFSGFLGPQVEPVLNRSHSLAKMAVNEANELVNNFPSSNYQRSARLGSHQFSESENNNNNQNNNNNNARNKPFSLADIAQARRFSDDLMLPNEYSSNNNGTGGSFFGKHSQVRSDFALMNDDNFQPPCGFDTLDNPNALFAEEKRISGEDHFERYNFSKSADEIRVAATVKEFKKLVVDNTHLSSYFENNNNNNNNTQDPVSGVFSTSRKSATKNHIPAKFAVPGGGRSVRDDMYRQSGDPHDQQHVVEGLLGTHQRLSAPTNVELETIRILKNIAASNKNTQQKDDETDSVDRTMIGSPGRKREADGLTKRLAAGVTESKRRQLRDFGGGNNNNNNNNNHNYRPQSANTKTFGRPSSSSNAEESPFVFDQTHYVPPAASAVPRPPPDYYKNSVSSRGVREARLIEEGKVRVASEMLQQQKVDPNPMHHRPPFRLKGAKMGANNTKASTEEQALEDDIREDIRLFEWRRAAQEDATQRAKVAVVREKQLDAFRRRQAEHFREALSRFEPGALQRAERAIQHRIGHELVQKYGAAQFLSSTATTPGTRTGGDVVIPTSFQVCAREAAVAAAETARNEKMIQRHQAREEQRKIIEETHSAMRQRRSPSMMTSRPSAVDSQHERRNSSSEDLSSPTTRNVPNRPETARTTATSSREQIFIRNRTQMIATQGLPKQKKEYVSKDLIESSGYKSWGGSIFPRGVTAEETDESKDFVASAKTVQREIEEMESRCPSLSLEKIAKQQFLAAQQQLQVGFTSNNLSFHQQNNSFSKAKK